MLRDMYLELFKHEANTDIEVYFRDVFSSFVNDRHHIYLDNELRGFFMLVDESSELTPNIKRYNGYRVYIVPSARKSRLLHEFYQAMFIEFPSGEILGYSELHSEQIPVLNKRHEHIYNVYKINRSI